MPESPDFDQIARRLDREFRSCIQSQESDQSVDLIAEQLRQVWNARGAADLAALEATVTLTKVASFEGSRRQTWGAIRDLDR